MTASELHSQPKRLWLLAGLAPLAIAAPLPGQAQAQVIWEPVTEEQTDQLQILVPAVDGGATRIPTSPSESNTSPQSSAPQPIVWEVVPDSESSDPTNTNPSRQTDVVWELLPTTPSVAADGSNNGQATAIVWEVLPATIAPLAPEGTDTIAEVNSGAPTGDSSNAAIEEPPAEVIAQEEAMQPRVIPGPPPPPPLQGLNRSIAFGDGLVGPDIGWRVPNGFRWSQRWFGDVALTGQGQRNSPNDPFFDNKKADATLIVHLNLLQTKHWSAAINTSIRSVNQDPNRQGGSTAIGEGASSGFRIARALGSTGGMAFGGEQVVQWDDQVDTGRNLYLMASKGWWLGQNGRSYPLLVANGGFGTGRFSHPDLQFGCVPVENKQLAGNVDNELCWSPIGTVALVMNEWWGAFLEYRAGMSQAGISLNLTGGIPLRLTGGVIFGENNELSSSDQYRWLVQASFGF